MTLRVRFAFGLAVALSVATALMASVLHAPEGLLWGMLTVALALGLYGVISDNRRLFRAAAKRRVSEEQAGRESEH